MILLDLAPSFLVLIVSIDFMPCAPASRDEVLSACEFDRDRCSCAMVVGHFGLGGNKALPGSLHVAPAPPGVAIKRTSPAWHRTLETADLDLALPPSVIAAFARQPSSSFTAVDLPAVIRRRPESSTSVRRSPCMATSA